MADFKALVHSAGRTSQIPTADNLQTGSGLKNTSGNLTITPAGTDLVLASGKTLSSGGGAGALDFSGGSGVFKTTTGAVTIGTGALTVSASSSTFDNAATFTSGMISSGEIAANGGLGRSTSGTLAIGTDAETTALTIGSVGTLTTVAGDLQINGTELVVGATTFNANVTFGDSNTDTVTFRAKIQGHGDNGGNIVAVSDNTTGLGSSAARWTSVDSVTMVARGDNTNTNKATLLAASLQSTVAFTMDLTAAAAETVGKALVVRSGAGGAAGAGAGAAGGSASFLGAIGGAGTASLAAGAGGAITITTGAAGAANAGAGGNGGALTMDSGAPTGAGVGGAISLGATNAASVGIGHSGITTTVTGALTQATGQVTLGGNVDANSGLDVSGAALTINNQAITQTTGGQVTFAGNVDANGGLDVVGALTQGTGAVTLSANGASSFTTSAGALTLTSAAALTLTAAAASTWSTTAGALTLTSAAAATWSTAAGALTLNGTGGMSLQTAGATRLSIADAAIQVQSGVILSAAASGVIRLDNDGRWTINGTAPGATVTAPNLDTLTNGSNADALHVHASGTATAITISGTAGENLTAGQVVTFDDSAGNARIFKADADAAGELADCMGLVTATVSSGNPALVQMLGEISVADANFDALPATSDVGKRVYMSTTPGNLTLTSPTASGSSSMRVGWITRGGTGAVKVAVLVGEGIVNP